MLADAAPRTAGEMQNTQQTYGAVEVAAAAPKKKLGRKVLVVAAALSLVGAAALSLAPKTPGVASLYGSTPGSLSGGTWSGNTSPQCMGARITPWTCAAQCSSPSCWPGSHCATCCTCPGGPPRPGPATPPWQPAAPQTPKVACGPIISQLKAVPQKGDIAYIQNTLMPICGVPSSGYPAPSAPVYQCPVCITRLAQAAANNDVCAAGATLVTGIAIDTDTSGGPGTAGGSAPAYGAGGQAKSLLCGMTRGDGVTKAFAHCPGCPGQPLAKTIMYEDDEIPCDACTKALPLTRLLFKDNTDVDNACKQCWK